MLIGHFALRKLPICIRVAKYKVNVLVVAEHLGLRRKLVNEKLNQKQLHACLPSAPQWCKVREREKNRNI